MTLRLLARQILIAFALLGTAASPAISAEKAHQEEAIHDLDRAFLNRAAEVHLYEQAASTLAKKSADRPDLKKYAKKTLADNETTGKNFKAIAEKRKVTLPTTPNAQQRQNLEKLSNLQGEAFDKAFLTVGAQYQFESVERYKRTAERSLDTAVKGYARRALPDLERHRAMFNTIAQAVVPEAVRPTGGTDPTNRMSDQK